MKNSGKTYHNKVENNIKNTLNDMKFLNDMNTLNDYEVSS